MRPGSPRAKTANAWKARFTWSELRARERLARPCVLADEDDLVLLRADPLAPQQRGDQSATQGRISEDLANFIRELGSHGVSLRVTAANIDDPPAQVKGIL